MRERENDVHCLQHTDSARSNLPYLGPEVTLPILGNPLDFLTFLPHSPIHPDLHKQVPPRIVPHKTVVTPLQGGEQSLQGVGSVPGKDHQAEGQDAGDHGDACGAISNKG